MMFFSEEFVSSPNHADVGKIGDRCFDEGLQNTLFAIILNHNTITYNGILSSVWDPYSFFTDPDPDPEVEDGDQYGSGYGSGSNLDPGL
jgi:hypothetical protein